MTNQRMLKAVLLVIALILIITSFWGMLTGIRDGFYAVSTDPQIFGHIVLDSNLRFYYGLTAGLGLVILWIIPSIGRQKTILSIVALMIFMGGVGRVISMMTFGIPSTVFLLFTLIELLFPLFIPWQQKIGTPI